MFILYLFDASILANDLFDCCKSCFKILNNVIDVLCADGEPDGIRLDSLIKQLLLRQLRVRCGCRMNHKALYIRNICKEGENLQVINKFPGLFLTAFDLKGKDGSSAIGEIPFIKSVVRMFRQRGMADLFHQRILL